MPSCELCPNQDGIFKETDAGRCDINIPLVTLSMMAIFIITHKWINNMLLYIYNTLYTFVKIIYENAIHVTEKPESANPSHLKTLPWREPY